jgi:hypothetical protein
MTARRGLLATVAAGLLYLTFGCGGGSGLPDKLKYAAPPQSVLMGGVSIQFQLAHARDDNFKVHFYVMNLSNQVMIVNRDGIGLRLPDGRVVQRREGNHDPYMLNPGSGHEVHVDFSERGMDMRSIQMASVVIGGISYSNDPMPRTVGEIPLSQAGAVDD